MVLGVPKRERRSWVVWEEESKMPDVIIELLSDSTRKIDKWEKRKFIKIGHEYRSISGMIHLIRRIEQGLLCVMVFMKS